MCGRYTLASPDPAQIRARFPVGESVTIRRRFNIAPGDDVLAVTSDRDGRPRGELLRWGLVPAWSEGPEPGARMINARVETVTKRPAYRDAFRRFRCLIVADGFYEWRRSAPGGSQPFHISRRDGEPFAFAGLGAHWRNEAQSVRSCSIITAAANPVIEPLHDRMPVILAREAEPMWLDPGAPAPLLFDLLHGLDAQETTLRPVSRAVNDARHDAPDCLADPAGEGSQPTLF